MLQYVYQCCCFLFFSFYWIQLFSCKNIAAFQVKRSIKLHLDIFRLQKTQIKQYCSFSIRGFGQLASKQKQQNQNHNGLCCYVYHFFCFTSPHLSSCKQTMLVQSNLSIETLSQPPATNPKHSRIIVRGDSGMPRLSVITCHVKRKVEGKFNRAVATDTSAKLKILQFP